jgi:hypothetical protein
VPTVTRAKAHRITVAAHTNNLAVVTTTWKQMAKTCRGACRRVPTGAGGLQGGVGRIAARVRPLWPPGIQPRRYCLKLQKYGLTSSIAPDEGGAGDDGGNDPRD